MVQFTPGQHLPTSCMLLCVFSMKQLEFRKLDLVHDLSTFICKPTEIVSTDLIFMYNKYIITENKCFRW